MERESTRTNFRNRRREWASDRMGCEAKSETIKDVVNTRKEATVSYPGSLRTEEGCHKLAAGDESIIKYSDIYIRAAGSRGSL
eukprot:scaffold403_cov157-Amphora_coffeaeformis.AAC.1